MSAPLFILTDFGHRDPYVGLMKAQILSLYPQATMVDLSHEVEQGDILHAAFWLEVSAAYLPKQCVCLAVVDPTVGSKRATLAVRWGTRYFVGPDNGIFSWLWQNQVNVAKKDLEIFSLDRQLLSQELPQIPQRKGSTFDGRDLFAPVGALLARALADDGAVAANRRLLSIASSLEHHECTHLQSTSTQPEAVHARHQMTSELNEKTAKIAVVDHFGNLITALKVLPYFCQADISLDGQACRWVNHYAEGAPGELLALCGSFGTLEIAIRNDSAALKVFEMNNKTPAATSESLQSYMREKLIRIRA